MRLLLFGSEKCYACQQLKKEFQKKQVQYIYIDVEKESQKTIDYMVTSLPTIIIENGKGEIKDMYIGNGQGIWKFLEKYKLIKGDK